MESWGARKIDFAAENFFPAPPQPTIGGVTATTTAVDLFAISTGVKMDF